MLIFTRTVLEIMATWTDVSNDEAVTQALEQLGDEITRSGVQLGTDLKFHYMNDAGSNQNVLGSYGSIERMRSVSRAYDPYQVFQHLQYGGFLLSGAR